jgi:hypothetical protein
MVRLQAPQAEPLDLGTLPSRDHSQGHGGSRDTHRDGHPKAGARLTEPCQSSPLQRPEAPQMLLTGRLLHQAEHFSQVHPTAGADAVAL